MVKYIASIILLITCILLFSGCDLEKWKDYYQAVEVQVSVEAQVLGTAYNESSQSYEFPYPGANVDFEITKTNEDTLIQHRVTYLNGLTGSTSASYKLWSNEEITVTATTVIAGTTISDTVVLQKKDAQPYENFRGYNHYTWNARIILRIPPNNPNLASGTN